MTESLDFTAVARAMDYGGSRKARYDHRIHALLLVAGGHPIEGVAQLFGEAVASVEAWMRHFASGGTRALDTPEIAIVGGATLQGTFGRSSEPIPETEPSIPLGWLVKPDLQAAAVATGG